MSPSERAEGCGFIKLLFICEQTGLETGLFFPLPERLQSFLLPLAWNSEVTAGPVPVGKGPATSRQKLACVHLTL